MEALMPSKIFPKRVVLALQVFQPALLCLHTLSSSQDPIYRVFHDIPYAFVIGNTADGNPGYNKGAGQLEAAP